MYQAVLLAHIPITSQQSHLHIDENTKGRRLVQNKGGGG